MRRYPLVNVAANPTIEYLSGDRSLLDAHVDVRRRGLEVLAFYHSHPTSRPIPSRKDLEQNFWPGVLQFIISPQAGGLVRGWSLSADTFQEADWEIVAE
jgi:proteasome lid subunit RPN8/RPN11